MKVTADKAIEHLNLITEHDAYTGYFQDVCKTAIEALEKQIPKKPVKHRKSYAVFHTCAICGENVVDYEIYCPECGQALDWSVDNA